jgi:hypothetical protein
MSTFTNWYAIPENREKHLAKMRAHYQANKPMYVAKAAKWQAANREKYLKIKNEYERKRRAKRKAQAEERKLIVQQLADIVKSLPGDLS